MQTPAVDTAGARAKEESMSFTRASLSAIGCAIVALLVVSSGASAQTERLPVAPRPASSADYARPCIPDPMKRYEMTDPRETHLFEPTGDPDRDFADMMSAHHQEGVDMAKRELASGKSTKLRAMARRIVNDQQREIVELDRWSARHNVRVSRRDPP
jgi:hypothetical protein